MNTTTMNNSVKKHLIIYHAIANGVGCDDGFGAAWAAQQWLHNHDPESEIILHEGIYGQPAPYTKIDPTVTVHILDFSYPTEIIEQIYKSAAGLIWLDHHETAINRLKKSLPSFIGDWLLESGPNQKVSPVMIGKSFRAYIEMDMNRSGAMMAWEYYSRTKADVPTPAPRLIAHIQDNDLWKFELEGTKTYISALRSYPQTLECWNTLRDAQQNTLTGYSEFMADGYAIERYYKKTLDDIMLATERHITILDIPGLSCNAPKTFASDLGNILAVKSGTYGAVWFQRSDGGVEYSLRSVDAINYNVATIAQSFGGGGHAKAAGFTIYPTQGGDTDSSGIKLWNIPATTDVCSESAG